MPSLRSDFWGLWSQPLLAGLAILLAAAVLSLGLFPAAHGSFVSTHGPATAFRSRRLFLTIWMLLATLFAILASKRSAIGIRLNFFGMWREMSFRDLHRVSALSAVLLC